MNTKPYETPETSVNLNNIENFPELWHEMVEHFHDVHTAHQKMVDANLLLFIEHYQEEEHIRQLLQHRYECHDDTKIMEDGEFKPYVWRYWRTKWRKEGGIDKRFTTAFNFDDQLDHFITEGVWHHVKHNRHHPEYHLDHDDMNQIDMIEMICDWCAMSEELDTNIYEWVEYVVPRRYHFSNYKYERIISTIKMLEEFKEKRKR